MAMKTKKGLFIIRIVSDKWPSSLLCACAYARVVGLFATAIPLCSCLC